MRRHIVAAAIALFAWGCQARQPATPDYRPVATIKDIMESMIDPNADVVWNSVATIITKEGTEQRRPRTDEEWATVRHAAVTVLEATNLLIMPGREIAKPGEKSQNPGIELEPADIAKLKNANPERWVQRAQGLHDAALDALRAIDSRNVDGMEEAGGRMDEACEHCHTDHWYPNDRRPHSAPSMRK